MLLEDCTIIYTDGSCRPNPGPGGWAAILGCNEAELVLSGNHPATTSNRMELTAAIEALKALKWPGCKVEIRTDSIYICQAFWGYIYHWKERGWVTSRNKPLKNLDLWIEMLELYELYDVTFVHVKAHADDVLNLRVDNLAYKAMEDK